MNNLKYRTISAIIAILTLVLAIYFFQTKGLEALMYLVVLRGSWEFCRMMIKNISPPTAPMFVSLINLLFYFFLVQKKIINFQIDLVLFIMPTMAFVIYGILLNSQFKSIQNISDFIIKSSFSFIYTAFIPATVTTMLHQKNGIWWFYCMLSVIFAGDIGAYIFGVNWGKQKIAPQLSPNKSLQGSIGGMLFSMFAALCFKNIWPDLHWSHLILIGLLGGIIGQIGDLFESLVKRVSGVKDSGTIMPGHGGILDRIDGVLLAAPLFFALSVFFQYVIN